MLRPPLIALSFMTIIPVRFRSDLTERQLLTAAVFFPMVGLLLGVMAAVSDTVFRLLFSPELSIALMLLVLELATGGLHLDGLSDTFDSLASKADQERRLDIMKEGSAGPVGVTAIFFTIGIKYLGLLSVSNLTNFAFYATLLFMPAISRWAMLAGMIVGRPARKDGLGVIYIGKLPLSLFIAATLLLFAIMAAPGYLMASSAPHGWWLFVIIAMTVAFLFVLIANRVSSRRFGGLTGDSFGAIGQITDVLFILTVIAWSRLYTL